MPNPSSPPPGVSEGMQALVKGLISDVIQHTMRPATADYQIARNGLLTAIAALEADRQWWEGEARDILIATCREDTRVIERICRRALSIRAESGRGARAGTIHDAYLKVLEDRANAK